MTDREQLARQWAEERMEMHRKVGEDYMAEESLAAAEHIMATTGPLTMADVEWDADKHYLAGADTQYGSVVMLHPVGETMVVHDFNSDLREVFDRDDVTPNGKRYELREVTEQEHPVVLEMLNDYDAAPEGTIVAVAQGVPWVKEVGEWWVGDRPATRESIAYQPRLVLRWGWGK